jgi:hypothetical protein
VRNMNLAVRHRHPAPIVPQTEFTSNDRIREILVTLR